MLSACAAVVVGPTVAFSPSDAVDATASIRPAYTEQRVVTATAYNSVKAQTQGDPFLSACGTRLKPGMKAIAVSRELFRTTFRCGQRVYIVELGEEYIVLDTMHRRWRNKIDLYMGLDIEAARQWGRQTVTIAWDPAVATASAGGTKSRRD